MGCCQRDLGLIDRLARLSSAADVEALEVLRELVAADERLPVPE